MGELLTKNRFMFFGIMLVAALSRVYYVTGMEMPVYDEVMHIPGAVNYMERGYPGPAPWHHPYLRNIIMYTSMGLLGDNPIGWRLPNIVAGISSVCLLYLLVFKLFDSQNVALIAAFLLAIDPLHINQSRLNPDYSLVVFAFVASFYFTILYAEKLKSYLLVMAGIMLGIGLSVKWYAFFTIIIAFFISFTIYGKSENKQQRRDRLLFIFSSLVVLPATVYLLTFYPWFGRGYSLVDFLWLQRDMYSQLQSMTEANFYYMAKLPSLGPYDWFVSLKIMGYKIQAGDRIIAVLYMGNPFVWILTLPSMAYLVYLYIAKRSISLSIVMMAFLIQYLPFLFISRPIYIHGALSVLPVAIIAIAFTIDRLFSKRVLYAFLTFNAVLIMAVYPLIIGYPVPSETYNKYLWWLDAFLVAI